MIIQGQEVISQVPEAIINNGMSTVLICVAVQSMVSSSVSLLKKNTDQ